MELDARRDVGLATRTPIRPEIQALRALAVGIVVIYHFWPHRLPGGYVGVDVFFVISGFLITTHLVSEYRHAGRIDLPRFWARRARRLLPASLLVLGVVALASPLLLPGAQLQQAFKQIAASALYLQNWTLAADSVDYLAAENAASPVQHFWSLSVEEQFYIFVPILLVVAAALIRHKNAMLMALAAIAVASFAYSVWETTATPGVAYFATTTRAWEFAAGGLLAFFATPAALPRVRALVAWIGWIGIVAVAFTYSAETPFPGYTAALPVIATLAIIWAGRSNLSWSPERFLAIRPTTFLGDISYSVYLWHWPLLIFAAPQAWPTKLALIGVVIGVSWLTWKFVERPTQRIEMRRPLAAFAVVVLGIVVVVVPSSIGLAITQQTAQTEVAAAQTLAEQEPECFGATAGHECERSGLVPDPRYAMDDKPAAYGDGCIARGADAELRTCVYGPETAATRVALIGDSHAVSWLPALQSIAKEQGWEIVTYIKTGCPHSTAHKFQEDATIEQSCEDWNSAVDEAARTSAPFRYVFVTHSAAGDKYASAAEAISGFRTAWRIFTERGAKVIVIRDTPRMATTVLDCLEENPDASELCALPEATAVLPDLMVDAGAGQDGVTVIDVNDVFCWDGSCKAAIGGVVAYRDHHHLTLTFGLTLGPVLEQKLREAELLD